MFFCRCPAYLCGEEQSTAVVASRFVEVELSIRLLRGEMLRPSTSESEERICARATSPL